MQRLIALTIFLGVSVALGSIFWVQKCINLNTITYTDSEQAFLRHYLRATGKANQRQSLVCQVVEIPLHLRKFD